MVTPEAVEKQLKKIHFNLQGWGRTEAKELHKILIPDEEIFEVVNGIYEGGFALLVATNFRMLLVDKKPLNYLTVEDLRFDMISEIDYAHRLMGARISISTGSKNLKFRSYNQPRLRKLITHVQHCMAESKTKESEHQQGQNSHLEQINQQLQTYLIAQHQHQQKLQDRLDQNEGQESQQAASATDTQPVKPSPELSDYLYAQSLLSQNQATKDQADTRTLALASSVQQQPIPLPSAPALSLSQMSSQKQSAELYEEGMQEIFGKQHAQAPIASSEQQPTSLPAIQQPESTAPKTDSGTVLDPLKIAYSKLPMALRNRKFGSPSFHAHSEADVTARPVPAQ